MSPTYDNVVVFGPTGGVGGFAALEASRRGAKVWLAMRDPSKSIDVIPSDVEKAGKFARIQADLTDPASVSKAIKESGAKAAYFYVTFGSPDNMRGTVQAMKDAGIEHVVFLSTFAIAQGVDVRSVPPADLIAYVHAQVELAIEEIGIPYFTTLRPAAFASNCFKQQIDKTSKPPNANIVYQDSKADHIVPEDIGAVGGARLVERPSDSKEVIYLCGPEVMDNSKTWALIKKVTGRDDIITDSVSKEQWLSTFTKHSPKPVADYLLKMFEETRNAEEFWPQTLQTEGVANIRKYSGRDATTFEEYLNAHKHEWHSF